MKLVVDGCYILQLLHNKHTRLPGAFVDNFHNEPWQDLYARHHIRVRAGYFLVCILNTRTLPVRTGRVREAVHTSLKRITTPTSHQRQRTSTSLTQQAVHTLLGQLTTPTSPRRQRTSKFSQTIINLEDSEIQTEEGCLDASKFILKF